MIFVLELSDFFITDVLDVCTTTFEKPVKNLMTNRPSYGISIAIDGEICYEHNGKKYISDKNHAIFFPKNATYVLNCYKPGSFTLVNFSCADGFNVSEFESIEISDNKSYLSIHNTLSNLHLFKTPNSRMEFMSVFYGMFSKLLSNKNNDGVYPVIRPAIKYLRDNLSNPELSNSKLADISGISEVYFRRLFKASFGVSPKQYLLDARIKKAKILLETGNISLEQIALNCGYANIYYFFKVFKEKCGCTPGEYRERFYKTVF